MAKKLIGKQLLDKLALLLLVYIDKKLVAYMKNKELKGLEKNDRNTD